MTQYIKTLDDFCVLYKLKEHQCSCSNPDLFKVLALANFTICQSQDELNKQEVRVVDNPSFRITYSIVSCLIAIVGLLGNGYVLYHFRKKWRRKELGSYQRIIFYLTLCNLCYGFTFLIPALTNFWSSQWVLGEPLCKIFYSLVPIGSSISIGFVTIMAFERYSGINNLISPVTTKTIKKLSMANIIISGASVIPRFLYLSYRKDTSICEVNYPSMKFSIVYNVLYLCFQYLIPLTMTIFFYCRMVKTLNEAVFQNRLLKESIQIKVFEKKVKETFRVKQIVKVIVISFSLTVPVYQICYITLLSVGTVDRIVYEIITFFSVLAYQAHVALHPVLFCGMYQNLQRVLRSMGRGFVRRTRLMAASNEVRSMIETTTKNSSFYSGYNQTSEIEL